MSKFDLSDFASHIFGGLMMGIIIGGYAGKTVMWMVTGAIICGAFKAASFMTDYYKKEKQDDKISRE